MGAMGRHAVTQEAFDGLVRENMEEFAMAAGEAVEDAVHTLTMQGADLTGIVTAYSASGQREEHLATLAATQLREALAAWEERGGGGGQAVLLALSAFKGAVDTADQSEGDTSEDRAKQEGEEGEAEKEGVRGEGGGAAAAAAAGGGVGSGDAARVAGRSDGLHAAVGALRVALGAVESGAEGEEGGEGGEGRARGEEALCDALRCMEVMLTHVPGARDDFFRLSGPSLLASALAASSSSSSLRFLTAAACTVRAACTENEVIKEALMEGAVHVAILNAVGGILKKKGSADVDTSAADVAEAGSAMCACCGALRSLVTNDDVRVAASKTFTNARTMAEAGAADVLLGAAAAFSNDVSVLPSVLAALKAIAVNEDICRSIASQAGVPLVLGQLRVALALHCSSLAAPSASLLAQLAGSDANKALIVEAGGMPLLVDAMKAFLHHGAVLQELLACMAALTLRNPAHAAAAVAAGVLDAAVDAMEGRGATAGSQWQACQVLRNLAVRNPEHRPMMVEMGLEALIRKVKAKHRSCRDVCSAALRDMGLDNYNQ
ncbi:hypothetical protein CLOP_g10392 [Closterium sp. NIES-67]|nr:hypothetical protein CLOP_g10392 [Closterium sp. NIES-67]